MLNFGRDVKPTLPLMVMSFFAADVQAGVGPFFGIYLQAHGWTPDLQAHGWTPDRIGTVLTIAGIVWISQGFWPVTLSQIATAVGGATMGPALAGLTLGIVGRHGNTGAIRSPIMRAISWRRCCRAGSARGSACRISSR